MTANVAGRQRLWRFDMTHELIERARKQREMQEQRQQATQARQAKFDEALEELDRREYLLSFPDQHWAGDSHLQIKEDRDDLLKLLDEEDGMPDMASVAGPARGSEKTTDQLLTEIRESLDAGK
jgi:hypothetical protein